MRKTEFEELYSLIKFGEKYNRNEVIFYYEDRVGLKPLPFNRIIKKEQSMLTFKRMRDDGVETVDLPEYRIWLIKYKGKIIFDRRKNYQGRKKLEIEYEMEPEIDYGIHTPLVKCIIKHNWGEDQITPELLNNILHKQWGDFHLYNYGDMVLVPRDHPILVRCRGLIVTGEGNVANYPFDRFFNDFEVERASIDWQSASIYEKVDGSMISVWYYNGWQVTTRGSFYINMNEGASDFNIMFRRHFNSFEHLDKNKCYIFELVTGENRVVTIYDGDFISLLGIRDLRTLKEEHRSKELMNKLGVRRLKQYKAISVEECRNHFKQMRDDEEGVVIVDENFNRMKIKQESYFKLSHIVNLKEEVIFDYILGKLELDAELLQYDREVRDRVSDIENTWKFVKTEVELIYNEISGMQIRKDFAEKAMQYPFYSVLFRLYDGKSYVDKLKWKQVTRWEKYLKNTV